MLSAQIEREPSMRFFGRMLPGLAAIAVLALFQALAGGLDSNLIGVLAVVGTLATFLVAYWLNPAFAHGRRRWRKLWGQTPSEPTPTLKTPRARHRRR